MVHCPGHANASSGRGTRRAADDSGTLEVESSESGTWIMTAEYQHVQVEQRGPALWVTLNRPAVRNAFNPAMIAELTALFTGIEADGETRVVVLAGAGAGFCAGADLTWMREMAAYTHDENVADALRLAAMLEALEGCAVPG